MLRIAVIGAGPAGSVAALLLARAGLDVTLVEQHRFPRDKVCGEGISALGTSVLERAGLLPRLGEVGAVPMTRAGIHAPGGSSARFPLPRPILGLSRHRLDELLLRAAAEAGARILQPWRCESAEPADDGVRLRLRSLETNCCEPFEATIALVADGRSALLNPRPRPTGDFAIKAHFRDISLPRDAVALFGGRGHYGGAAPIEDGLWNVAFTVPGRRLRECPDPARLFMRLTSESAELGRRFRGARPVGRWLSSPLPRYRLRFDWPERIIPIGNAAAAIEPIGGEGMGLAMRSAELAATAILHWVRRGEPLSAPALQGQFAALWRGRWRACRAAALWLSQPALCDWAGLSLDLDDMPARVVLGWMGKAG